MAAPSLKSLSNSYTVTLEPRFAEALERVASEGETTAEKLLTNWTELTLVEIRMGRELPPSLEEAAAIERGIAQLDRGEGVPQEQVMAEIKARHGW